MTEAQTPITHVCVLLDESGSMQRRKRETISGFNEYLGSLKKDKGDKVLFTFTLFDSSKVEERYRDKPINEVPELNEETYKPNANTPLHDAIGRTINSVRNMVGKDELVIFAIFTDGEENCSTEYNKEAIKSLIAEQEKAGWEFVFMGVGIDAFATGTTIGLSQNSIVNVADHKIADAFHSHSLGLNMKRGVYVAHGYANATMCSTISDQDRKDLGK